MKKLLYAAFASAMLLAGNCQAADLPLADGHILPLDASISVHQGKDSYYGKQINETLSSPDMEKKILSAVENHKQFAQFSASEKEDLAKETLHLLKDVQLGQIVSDTGDHVYQAFVISCPMTKESFARWETIANKISKDTESGPFDGKLTWEGYQALLSSTAFSQGSQENAAISLGDGLGQILLSHAQWSQSRSKSGVPYMQYTLFSTQEKDGLMTPLYATVLITPSDQQVCFTVIASTSTDGLYFQPYIQKAMEALK